MNVFDFIKQIWKRYGFAITMSLLFGLAFPFLLNWLVLIQAMYPIAGNPETWIAFWPSYLSAIASFGMIALTALALYYNSKTLANNKEQLDELKRQWKEEHMSNVSVSFNILNTIGAFRIVNTSIVEVKELSIIAEFYHDGQKVEQATFPELRTLKINIEPKGIRNVRIRDICFDEPTTNDYFILHLNYNGEEKEPITVSCNQIYTIGDDMIWRELIQTIKKYGH